MSQDRKPTSRRLSVRQLLRPHTGPLLLGFIAVLGEGAANLLQPWPLKIVLDDVLHTKGDHGQVLQWVHKYLGADKMATLEFACVAVLLIALLDAICTYGEKYLTTSVGQWVTHDLRRTFYSRIQRLSLAYHDKKRTGDLISRVTSDVDAIQRSSRWGCLGS